MHLSLQDIPIRRGCYQLILQLHRKMRIQVGRLGEYNFSPGFYVYSGSAQNSLNKRIKRHLKSEKKLYWHIDYLTSHPAMRIIKILLYPDYLNECRIHRIFCNVTDAVEHPQRFGSGDCKNKCRSHLSFLRNIEENFIIKMKDEFPLIQIQERFEYQ